MVISDYSEDCCSFEATVKGVMFYPGVKQLNPAVLSRVKFVQDQKNPVHKKAVFVKFVDSEEILGHRSRPVAESASIILDISGVAMLG